MLRPCAVLLLCGATLVAGASEVTVLTADRIHTSDPGKPHATAMAWDAGGRLLAVGDARQLTEAHPAATRIDAGSATVIAGLVDAHGHVMGLGHASLRADLGGTRGVAEVIERLREAEQRLAPGDWLQGGGWDQNHWPGRAFPTAADLDAAFPDRPVWLERVDGHAGWANSAALAQAVSAAARPLGGDWQPEGGRIERVDGQPTGVFVDRAMDLVNAVVPLPSRQVREQALANALRIAVSNGLTGVHDMGVSREDLALMRDFADAGRLPLRIEAYADGASDALDDLCANGLYHHAGGRLAMRGVKLYMDGALGSRGAALVEDYSDDPGNRGLLVTEPAAYEAAVRKARGCDVQVATHAIGDRGNQVVLDTYARVLGEERGSDHRWRIEHAQVVALDDIPRFAELGVIASMQPTHATSDMPWAQDRVGPERIAGAYAWQRFRQAGVRLALGSDFPVESPDPRLGLYAAVTRQDRQGLPEGGWLPAQRLAADQALAGFTRDAAHAARNEARTGRLAAGLRADFVVLKQDPLAVDAATLDELEVLSTWVDGKPVYQAGSAAPL